MSEHPAEQTMKTIPCRATFKYPDYGTPANFPAHVAHSGQTVTVIARHPDGDCGVEPLYTIQADDGWTGEAFESELEPADASH